MDQKVFNILFNQIETYAELPEMFEKAALDVSRSDYDSLKDHAICYHIAGLTNTIYGALRALKRLDDESKILEIKLDEEMDQKEWEKYMALKTVLDKLI